MAAAIDTSSPLDAMFLELEQADEGAVMSIGAAMVFAPLPTGGAPPFDQVVQNLAERLQQFPRFSQRLSSAHWRPALAQVGARRPVRDRRPHAPSHAPVSG